MNKKEFIAALRLRLAGLPAEDREDRLGFYAEMIDDHIEEGLAEEAAVAAIGSVETVAEQIIAETPLLHLVKDRVKPKRRLRPWEITLLALGSPLWISLVAAAFSVILSLIVTFWAVIVSLWSVFVALIGCGAGLSAFGAVYAIVCDLPIGLGVLGAGLVCTGLSIFAFCGCKATTKGLWWLMKAAVRGIKRLFVRGEERYV